MRRTTFLFFLVALCLLSIRMHAESDDVEKIIKIEHPRILLLKGDEKAIQQAIAQNTTWAKMHQAILNSADAMIDKPVLERKLEGVRLLDVSREALRRIFFLSYAYRVSGNEKYAQRAEKEMLAVSAFSDWQPPHFLGVAELALGVSIGYDWLYETLSPDSRFTIENALITKAIEPSFEATQASIFMGSSNWNQVCNAGMVYAALAIAEKRADLAEKVFTRSIPSIAIPMKSYDPDGAFAEGYMYWQYGTVFNIFMLDALQKVGITDLRMADFKGFAKTSTYLLNMTGTSGESFNYMDCIPNSILNSSQFWFASQLNEPSLLWVEKSYMEGNNFKMLTDGNGLPLTETSMNEDKYSQFTTDRTLPALMIWGIGIDLSKVTKPLSNHFVGQGETPVCLMRTSWVDKKAIYIGFKTGSPGTSHGHMDVGSFVLDADGERWASDFGMQNYNSLESKGVNLWSLLQNSTRWNTFRYNNLAHNTLTVNGKYQDVKGRAKIDKSGFLPDFSFAISDLSAVYKQQLQSFKRGIALVNNRFAVVQDEFRTSNKVDTIRWTMLTKAEVKFSGQKIIELTLNGKKLVVRIDTPAKFTLREWSTKPKNDFDADNTGTTLVGFEMILPANSQQTVRVKFIPESAGKIKAQFAKPLSEWK
ncbi:MAG: heparinase II/III family protein [Bacteroidia bacterium]|nr:heparinase II/III family protein [Bacteroidia bacterium]